MVISFWWTLYKDESGRVPVSEPVAVFCRCVPMFKASYLYQYHGAGAAVACEACDMAWPRACSLPYLEACLKESLRLYPPAPTIIRMASRPMELGGFPVRPGQWIAVAAYSMHRNPAYWQVRTITHLCSTAAHCMKALFCKAHIVCMA